MNNSTLKILETAAWNVLRREERMDPTLRELHTRQERLHREFVCRHKNNRALRQYVLELLDVQGAIDCIEAERLFRLGLQMGLELRALDQIPSEG